MQLTGRHYETAESIVVTVADGKVTRVEPAGKKPASPLPYIAPGFVDLQVNGYGGQEFSALDLTPEKVARIVEQHAPFGVTALCPTVTTGSFETLAHGLRAIHRACNEYPQVARRMIGIHLEGPYISREDGARGAHPLEHCRPPDWDEFERLQASAGGQIRLVTLSPEYDAAPRFIAQAVASGVTVSIGHTAATSEQIRAAVDAGASLSTHLGNGAHGMLRRHPNYIWDQLADDRLTASLIVDGHHLPPAVVKTFVRAKTPERCLLVSDESGLAGLPPGVYDTNLCKLEILASGRVVIAGQDQLLAGASLPIGVGVANVMHFAGVDLPTAVHMASTTPAKIVRHPAGGLKPGDVADLVLFDLVGINGAPRELRVRATVSQGELIYDHLL